MDTQTNTPLRRPDGERPDATGTVWRIVPERSRAEFAVGKRLALVKRLIVTGHVGGVEGTVTLDGAGPADVRVALALDAATIDTGHARRDRHLRSADFFDVERYPRLTFVGQGREATGVAGHYRATGALTIRNVTRPVDLELAVSPADALGAHRAAGITATATLDRRDFALTWGNALITIADEVRVTVEVEIEPA